VLDRLQLGAGQFSFKAHGSISGQPAVPPGPVGRQISRKIFQSFFFPSSWVPRCFESPKSGRRSVFKSRDEPSVIRSLERPSWGISLAPGYMHSRILTPGVGLSPSFWRKTMLTSISAGVVVVAPGDG